MLTLSNLAKDIESKTRLLEQEKRQFRKKFLSSAKKLHTKLRKTKVIPNEQIVEIRETGYVDSVNIFSDQEYNFTYYVKSDTISVEIVGDWKEIHREKMNQKEAK